MGSASPYGPTLRGPHAMATEAIEGQAVGLPKEVQIFLLPKADRPCSSTRCDSQR